MNQQLNPSHLGTADETPVFDPKNIIRVSSSVVGGISGNLNSGLRGWLFDSAAPGARLGVEILAENEVVARVSADKFDRSLAEAKVGDGCYAFITKIDWFPSLKLPVSISFRLSGTSTSFARLEVTSSLSLKTIARKACYGHVDGVSNGVLAGWAYDFAADEPASVDILLDNRVIATAVCDRYRSDLVAAGYGDGRAGFSYALPSGLLDASLQSITVCYAGTDKRLPNGSLLFGHQADNRILEYISNLNLEIKRCRADVVSLEKKVIERHEALLSIQRENIEQELSVLRKLLNQVINSGDPMVIDLKSQAMRDKPRNKKN